MQRFCSKCYKVISRGSKSGMCKGCSRKGIKRPFIRRKPLVMAKCKNCLKDFEYKWHKVFCCRVCSNKFNANANSISKIGEKNPMFGKKSWNSGIFGVVKHPSRQGKNNHFWKGGISREKYKLRRSGEWKKWRKEVFERDGYTCQKCGKKGNKIVPHHIKLFTFFEKERFNVDNGVTVCVSCHKYLHRKENSTKKIINLFN